jgi:hypothetical protein
MESVQVDQVSEPACGEQCFIASRQASQLLPGSRDDVPREPRIGRLHGPSHGDAARHCREERKCAPARGFRRAGLVRVQYRQAEAVTIMDQALGQAAMPKNFRNGERPPDSRRGDPDAAFAAAPVRVEAAAAVANAVWHATGVRVRDLPIRVEDLLV